MGNEEYSLKCNYPFERVVPDKCTHCDIQDGNEWKAFVEMNLLINKYTLGFELNFDGLSLWGLFSSNYSIIPIFLTNLNLPPEYQLIKKLKKGWKLIQISTLKREK